MGQNHHPGLNASKGVQGRTGAYRGVQGRSGTNQLKMILQHFLWGGGGAGVENFKNIF